jgi:hypothetical protein
MAVKLDPEPHQAVAEEKQTEHRTPGFGLSDVPEGQQNGEENNTFQY